MLLKLPKLCAGTADVPDECCPVGSMLNSKNIEGFETALGQLAAAGRGGLNGWHRRACKEGISEMTGAISQTQDGRTEGS